MSLVIVAVILVTHFMTPSGCLSGSIGDPSGAEQNVEDLIFTIEEEMHFAIKF